MLSMPRHSPHRPSNGFTLLEVLITVVLLAFGLLGLATLQSKMQLAEVESYQRSQAVVLLNDMTEMISANGANAINYVTGASIGTGDAQPSSCAAIAFGASRDICEWSNALKGAAEADSGGNNVGAMIGAHGCVTQLQAEDATAGVCKPGIYRVSVIWQGLHSTVAPNNVCPGDAADAKLRSLSSAVTIGLTDCN